MNELASIGANIKRLRKERKLTQEELAEQLNLTTQAVSKWESGAGLPDISQVVPLANVFGVSIDVIFGMVDASDAEVERLISKIEEPINQYYRTAEGDYEEIERRAYADYQDALKLYPNNTKLLLKSVITGSSHALYLGWQKGNEARVREIRRECIRQANLVVNYSKNTDEINQARDYLVTQYSELGEFDRAEEEAMKFPVSPGYWRGPMLANIMNDKKDRPGEIRQRCANISRYIEALYGEILALGTEYHYDGRTEDEYRTYRAAYDILSAIHGDGVHSTAPIRYCFENYTLIAISCVELGRPDEAVDWLERIYDHFKNNEWCFGQDFHVDSPLLREETFHWEFDSMSVAKEILLNKLSLSFFDPIRETERFRELVKKAESMA